MRRVTLSFCLALAACESAAPAADLPAKPVVPAYAPVAPLHLSAKTMRSWSAPEADQGVAVDGANFYAIDNSVIAKYALASGKLLARWIGPEHGLIRHLNSCFVDAGRLWCSNSNYSLTPMGSSIEVFDASTMTHVDTHSLGLTDEGSLTWFDKYEGGWLAGFAQYDETGGLKFKDHTFASVVTFDAAWRRTGGWLFPEAVVARMAPRAASGGAIGPDGLLYVLGHDRPEMYVFAKPSMGPYLLQVAVIDLEAEGQAFAWSRGSQRLIYAIDRKTSRVLEIGVPAVDVSGFPDARRFSR